MTSTPRLKPFLASLLATAAFSFASPALAQTNEAPAVREYQTPAPQRPTRTRPLREGVTGLGQTQDVIREPRFIVEAVSFDAVDESGPNFPGSDEVYAMFRSGDNVMATRLYEDVDDDDDPIQFERHQSCIFPAVDPDGHDNGRWSCAAQGARGPLRFEVTLYELDPYYAELYGAFCLGGSNRDDLDSASCWTHHSDLLFRHTFSYEVSQILARLDPGCRCFTETARYTEEDWRGDLVYDFTFRITRVDDGREGPAIDRDPDGLNQPVHRSGTFGVMLNQGFEFDAGAVVAAGGDFTFSEMGTSYFLTPGGGAKIWPGGSTARGYAACFAQRMSANYVTTRVNVPAIGSYACYVTSDGRVGEFRVDSLMRPPSGIGALLTVSYTTWQ